MDMIKVTTVNHGVYEAPAEKVSSFMVLYAGKGVREMRIDWCDLAHSAEWIWDDVTERSTWAVMFAAHFAAPLVMR